MPRKPEHKGKGPEPGEIHQAAADVPVEDEVDFELGQPEGVAGGLDLGAPLVDATDLRAREMLTLANKWLRQKPKLNTETLLRAVQIGDAIEKLPSLSPEAAALRDSYMADLSLRRLEQQLRAAGEIKL